MAWEDWRDPKNASTWNEILDLLEEGARRFSVDQKRALEITVTRARWDTPDVELRWGLGPLQRNIHARVKQGPWPTVIELSGAAWKDIPGSRKRHVTRAGMLTREFEDAKQLRKKLPKDLELIFREVSALIPVEEERAASAEAHGD